MGKNIRIKIIGFTPQRSRQPIDLASILAERGHDVVLYQLYRFAEDTVRESGSGAFRHVVVADPFARITNPWLRRKIPHHLIGVPLRLRFFRHVLQGRCDVLFGVNLHGLEIASWGSRFNRAPIVYYALEHIERHYRQNTETRICRARVKAILCPEANRLRILSEHVGRDIPGFVVPNAPRKGIATPPSGRLLTFLRDRYGFGSAEKIVLFHGSYQTYSHLEEIIRGTVLWHPKLRLVIMLRGTVPAAVEELASQSQGRAVLVPPVGHRELYAWVRDAHVGLLPYEDDSLEGVAFCSPQKMFDYLVCGVPFLGSQRPMIQEIAEELGAGLTVNMLEQEKLAAVLERLVLDTPYWERLAANARRGYETKYNYDSLVAPMLEYVEGIYL